MKQQMSKTSPTPCVLWHSSFTFCYTVNSSIRSIDRTSFFRAKSSEHKCTPLSTFYLSQNAMADVFGIISGVLSAVATVGTVYDATKDEMGLLPDFKKTVALLSSLLDGIEGCVNEETDDTNIAALTPILKSCKAKVAQLHRILEKVGPVEGDSWTRRYYKAVRAIGKGGRVKKLVEGVLKDLQLIEANPGYVSLIEQTNLTMAIEEVSELEPALPDVFEDASTFAHYGSAAKNVGTAVASQYNRHITDHQNNDPAQQYIDNNRVGKPFQPTP